MEHAKNTLQNITTEGMPQSVQCHFFLKDYNQMINNPYIFSVDITFSIFTVPEYVIVLAFGDRRLPDLAEVVSRRAGGAHCTEKMAEESMMNGYGMQRSFLRGGAYGERPHCSHFSWRANPLEGFLQNAACCIAQSARSMYFSSSPHFSHNAPSQTEFPRPIKWAFVSSCNV